MVLFFLQLALLTFMAYNAYRSSGMWRVFHLVLFSLSLFSVVLSTGISLLI